MGQRLNKDMPDPTVASLMRELAAKIRQDSGAGRETAKEFVDNVILAFARPGAGSPPLVPHDPNREKELSRKLGAKIHELRKSLKFSGSELARRAGCCQAYVTRIEHGKCEPSLLILRRMAKALGVPVSELLKMYDE